MDLDQAMGADPNEVPGPGRVPRRAGAGEAPDVPVHEARPLLRRQQPRLWGHAHAVRPAATGITHGTLAGKPGDG